MVDEEVDHQINEELRRQWEVTERTLLASGNLGWEEAEQRLRKMGDAA